MAVIEGQIAALALSGIVNDRLSVGLHMLKFDSWPPHDIAGGVNLQGSTTAAMPIGAHHRSLTGQIAHGFSDDWYHRIHVLPPVIALGYVTSTQVSEVVVWNAWLHAVTMLSLDGVDEGMSLAGPSEFPIEMPALGTLAWDVSVLPDGPSTIDARITWTFSDSTQAALQVTGTRIVAWTLAPDWEDGIREKLAWATDILPSPTRKEQRRSLRISPRREFEATLILEGRERTLYDLSMHGWGGRVWALPIWPDIQRLTAPVALEATSITCSTAGRDFRAGGLAMVCTSAFAAETVEIEAITGSALQLKRPVQRAWPVGARLYPCRTAQFVEQPKDRRITDTIAEINARFLLLEPSDWPELSLPSYRGFPVYDARPDETEDLTGTFERMLSVLDNESGIPFSLDTAEAGFRVQSHRSVLNGITERSDFRSLLYTLRGRQVAVWVPTHADDLQLQAPIGSASVSMTVANVGYSRFGLQQLGRKDIRIQLRNGTVFLRRITNAAEIDEATEQLSFDTALGQVVALADVWRISFMALVRQQSDQVELHHVTDVEGVAISEQTFVTVADE